MLEHLDLLRHERIASMRPCRARWLVVVSRMNNSGVLADKPAAVVEVLESVYKCERKSEIFVGKWLDLLCLPDIR